MLQNSPSFSKWWSDTFSIRDPDHRQAAAHQNNGSASLPRLTREEKAAPPGNDYSLLLKLR